MNHGNLVRQFGTKINVFLPHLGGKPILIKMCYFKSFISLNLIGGDALKCAAFNYNRCFPSTRETTCVSDFERNVDSLEMMVKET